MPEPEPPSRSETGSPAGLRPVLRALGPQARPFALLSIATFFEGFDTKLVSVVQPLLGAEFDASRAELGLALGISSAGMMASFFVLQLADRVGRRPVFLAALASYAVLTLATAFATSLVAFTVLQLFARMAMVVELGLAYVILSETVPAAVRGRANGLLGAIAALGATPPLALLAPLTALGLGWRGLFLVGAFPILLLPLYWRGIAETPVYLRDRGAAGPPAGEARRRLRALVSRRHRGTLLRLTTIWLTINVWTGTALYFLALYVYDERGWNERDLAWLPLGTIPFGLGGYVVAGLVMDRLGRRGSTALYLVAAFAATTLCYQSRHDAGIYLGWFLLIGLNGVWTIVTTWTTELFPTELRATALGLSSNLIGRIGLVVAPIVAGALADRWGSTALAVNALACVTLACLPIVWWGLPETRGVDLRSDGPVGVPPDPATTRAPTPSGR